MPLLGNTVPPFLSLVLTMQFVPQIPAQIPGQISLPCSTFVCGPRDGKHWLSGFVGASQVTEYKRHNECNYPQEMTDWLISTTSNMQQIPGQITVVHLIGNHSCK